MWVSEIVMVAISVKDERKQSTQEAQRLAWELTDVPAITDDFRKPVLIIILYFYIS